MTNEQRAELKNRISAALADTKTSISELEELTKPISPENAIGRVNRMDAINNKSINEAALVQAKAKLDKLQFAAKKVNEPDFGTCRRCGNAIPMGLLILMPKSYYRVGSATTYPLAKFDSQVAFSTILHITLSYQ
jgi:DnaK suppressor protein